MLGGDAGDRTGAQSHRERHRIGIGRGLDAARDGRERALVVGLGVGQHVEHGRVIGAQRRREHAPDRAREVLGGDRLAVRPAGVGAEMEGVGEGVGRHLPAFRHARDRVEVHGILADQALEEGGGHVDLGQAGDEVGIKPGQVGAQPALEHLIACALFDGRLAPGATGRDGHKKAQKDTKK